MANKKDLAEAQSYSRARLITAFTSGIPDGKELAPKKGLMPVVVGIGLTAIIVLISVFSGMFNPGLPADWANNKLIVAKNTASRFISVHGTLYPVINTTSARLLIPSKDYRVIIVDDSQLEGIPVGNSVGIAGAPDILPNRDRLASKQFISCMNGGSMRNVIAADVQAAAMSDRSAVLANVSGARFLIAGGRRYALPKDTLTRDSILRILGLGQIREHVATIQWVNLFKAGTDLTTISVPGAGGSVEVNGIAYTVGSVVSQQGGSQRYVVMKDASLSPISGIAAELYAIGKPDASVKPQELTIAQLGGFTNASTSFIPADWPTGRLTAADGGDSPCALLEPKHGSANEDGEVRLATVTNGSLIAKTASHTVVSGGSGALVRALGGSDAEQGMLYVIDGSGIAYPVPDDTAETVARLGYHTDDPIALPRAWASIYMTGVSLSSDAAGRQAQITAGTQDTSAADGSAADESSAAQGGSDAAGTGSGTGSGTADGGSAGQ